jgi:hypothetical protein
MNAIQTAMRVPGTKFQIIHQKNLRTSYVQHDVLHLVDLSLPAYDLAVEMMHRTLGASVVISGYWAAAGGLWRGCLGGDWSW